MPVVPTQRARSTVLAIVDMKEMAPIAKVWQYMDFNLMLKAGDILNIF